MIHPLTGSQVHRASKCPASMVLPRVYRNGPHRDRGVLVHRYLQCLVSGVPRDAALSDIDPKSEAYAWCIAIDPEKVPRGDAEVSFAWHPGTGKVIWCGGRPYNVPEPWIPGTADVIVHGQVPTIYDWKSTGWEIDLDSARAQVRFYAMCVSVLLSVDRVQCKIVIIKKDGIAGEHVFNCDFDDHIDTAAEFRRTLASIQSASTEVVTTGAHCQGCPSMLPCPATQSAMSALGTKDLGPAWAAAKRLEASIAALRDWVAHEVDDSGPLPTGDGRVVKRIGAQLRIVKE